MTHSKTMVANTHVRLNNNFLSVSLSRLFSDGIVGRRPSFLETPWRSLFACSLENFTVGVEALFLFLTETTYSKRKFNYTYFQ